MMLLQSKSSSKSNNRYILPYGILRTIEKIILHIPSNSIHTCSNKPGCRSLGCTYLNSIIFLLKGDIIQLFSFHLALLVFNTDTANIHIYHENTNQIQSKIILPQWYSYLPRHLLSMAYRKKRA